MPFKPGAAGGYIVCVVTRAVDGCHSHVASRRLRFADEKLSTRHSSACSVSVCRALLLYSSARGIPRTDSRRHANLPELHGSVSLESGGGHGLFLRHAVAGPTTERARVFRRGGTLGRRDAGNNANRRAVPGGSDVLAKGSSKRSEDRY